MAFSQLVLLILAIYIAFRLGRKYFINRSLTHYSISETKERAQNKNTLLLDVRTAGERKMQSIPGSLHIPVTELKSRLNELKKYKGKEIICYCRSGSRSTRAAYVLQKAGLKSANMKGGITAWRF